MARILRGFHRFFLPFLSKIAIMTCQKCRFLAAIVINKQNMVFLCTLYLWIKSGGYKPFSLRLFPMFGHLFCGLALVINCLEINIKYVTVFFYSIFSGQWVTIMQKKYILGQFRYCSQWHRLVSQLQSIPPWSLASIGT